ncbi:unnamed protein product [Clavelina lepadiformis]|uniref:Uncharacterized protein n=1 Tax=Clavelina lepadiformis TaxID=159417 RepID=A0ABP0FTK9_CLALP
MSMVPGCSAGVHIDDITSNTAAGSLPSVTFVDLTLPDSPDSPVQLSSPVPHGRIVRPGEQGSLAPLTKRAVLAGLQQTVLRPIYRQYRVWGPDITVPILALPAQPTNSADDLFLWFQRMEEIFELVPQLESVTKIFSMIAATPAVHSVNLLETLNDKAGRISDKLLLYDQFKLYLHTLLLSEVPSVM